MGVELALAGMAAYGAYRGVQGRRRAGREIKINNRNSKMDSEQTTGGMKQSGARSNALYDDMYGSYRDMIDNPGSRYNSRGLPGFEEFSQTGGWSPENIAEIEGNIGQWDELSRGEGAAKTFKEFSETGGYTDVDKANVRGRIAASTPSIYEGINRNMQRQAAVNPYASGFDAAGAKLGRESSRASADAVREGEIGLSESIRSGRMQGTQGLTQTVLAAIAGKNNARMGLTDSINEGRQWGYEGMEDVSRQEYDAAQRDVEFGMSGLGGLRDDEIRMLLAQMGMGDRQQERNRERGAGLRSQRDSATDDSVNSIMQLLASYYGSRGSGGSGTLSRIPTRMR